ncbi:MAG: hypothetical protein KGM49_07450 [Sphingomonadales bacterium]|nr:hypothetical protein [Sphingomonadales bacterium]
MFTKYLPATRSTLDKAIMISIAAMLAMNAFVLTQQHQTATLAAAPVAAATGEA